MSGKREDKPNPITDGAEAAKSDAVRIAEIQAQQQADALKAQQAKEAMDRKRFDKSVNTAFGTGIESARNYFIARGLNPDDYMPMISQAANAAKTRIPDMSAAPGTYFDALGETVYGNEQTRKRGDLTRQVQGFAPSGFENRRIADTSDDATIAAILAEQRGTADKYIDNLISRGVITGAGAAGARADLDRQSFGAKSRLDEIGNTVLNQGRTKIGNIANQAREGAANYELGMEFNPFDYATDIDTALSGFFEGLGGQVRGLIPADLFNTAGLPNVAGAAQGQQNTRFDPRALAGVFDEEDDEQGFINAF